MPGGLPSPGAQFWAIPFQGCSCPRWLGPWENLEQKVAGEQAGRGATQAHHLV